MKPNVNNLDSPCTVQLRAVLCGADNFWAPEPFCFFLRPGCIFLERRPVPDVDENAGHIEKSPKRFIARNGKRSCYQYLSLFVNAIIISRYVINYDDL